MYCTEYLLFNTASSPVCVCFYCIYKCVFHLHHVSTPCITSGINQSSLLVICQLHFPACSNAKFLCKPLREINTINTERFNSPKAHDVFKYLSTGLPLSSSVSVLSVFPFQMHHHPSLWFFLLHQASFCVLPCLSFFFVPLFPRVADRYFPLLPISLLTGDIIIPHPPACL